MFPCLITTKGKVLPFPSPDSRVWFELISSDPVLKYFVKITRKCHCFNLLCVCVCVWCLLGSDLILILLSYCFILRAVLHLQAGGAATKALSTCGSHLILILFFYTLLLVFIFTNKAEKKVPSEVPILLNVLHHLIPPALNPIVYGVRTQEIKQGIIKLFKDHY